MVKLKPFLPLKRWLITYVFDKEKFVTHNWLDVFSATTDFTYYIRIRDIQIRKTWWKYWLFNIGDIILYSTDDSGVLFTLYDIRKPDLCAQQLLNLIYVSRKNIKLIERG